MALGPKVTILQFVGRVDAEGTAKLANYVQYKCHPVVDVAEWVQAGQEAIESAAALADPSSKTPPNPLGGVFAFALVER